MLYKEAKPVLDLFHNCPIRNVTKGELKASSEKNVPLSSVSVVAGVPLVRFSDDLYFTATVEANVANDDSKRVAVEFACEGNTGLVTAWKTEDDEDVAVTFIDLPKGGLDAVEFKLAKSRVTAKLYREAKAEFSSGAFLSEDDGKTYLLSYFNSERMLVSTDTVLTPLNGQVLAVSQLNWADFFDNLDAGNEVAPEVFVSSNIKMLANNDLFDNGALAYMDAYVHVGRDVSIATVSSGKNIIQFLMEFTNPHPLLPSIVQAWPWIDAKTPIKLVHYGKRRTEGTVTKAELEHMLKRSGYELTLKPLYKCHKVQTFDKVEAANNQDSQVNTLFDVVLTETPTEAYLTTGVARFKAASLNNETATLLMLANQQMVVVVTPKDDCSYRNEVSSVEGNAGQVSDGFAKSPKYKKTLDWVTKAFGDFAKVSAIDYLCNTNIPVIYSRADSTGNKHFASRFAEALVTHNGETVPVLIEREVNNCFIFRVKVGDWLVQARVDKDKVDYLPLTHYGYKLKASFVSFSQDARLPDDYRELEAGQNRNDNSFSPYQRKPYPILGLTKGIVVSADYKPEKTWQFLMKPLSDGNLMLSYWFYNDKCASYHAKVVKPQTTFCSWESALIIAV